MHEQDLVQINLGKSVKIEGNLKVPKGAKGVVLFAHGSGSSRHSPRNQFVAEVLGRGGIATLLIDLLTPQEESEERVTAHLRFNIDLLADRLVKISDWLEKESPTKELKLGYFGASTGAAAALAAATQKQERVKAIVSRGGRPDLAGPFLARVRAPTLLIVGGNDFPVIKMNEEALSKLTCEKKLTLVPGATHLFEEKGSLEEVAKLALNWFKTHF